MINDRDTTLWVSAGVEHCGRTAEAGEGADEDRAVSRGAGRESVGHKEIQIVGAGFMFFF